MLFKKNVNNIKTSTATVLSRRNYEGILPLPFFKGNV